MIPVFRAVLSRIVAKEWRSLRIARRKSRCTTLNLADTGYLDLDQRARFGFSDRQDMKQPPEEPGRGKEAPEPKLSRLEATLRVIEEYADDLREILKKLRRRLN